MLRTICIILLLQVLCIGCKDARQNNPQKAGDNNMAIKVTSTAFNESEMIPSKYTCDGQDISPPLAFDGIPSNARSLVLISDDPDAPVGTWVHWVMWNIPPETRELPEKMSTDKRLQSGAMQGVTDFHDEDFLCCR